jgi:hypothetical protein
VGLAIFILPLCHLRAIDIDPLQRSEVTLFSSTGSTQHLKIIRNAHPNPESDKMNNSQRYDTEEARQWAITFRLLTLAIVLAGLIIGTLAIHG